MQGLIDVEPKVFLDFVGFESKICVGKISIINLTNSTLAFKV